MCSGTFCAFCLLSGFWGITRCPVAACGTGVLAVVVCQSVHQSLEVP